MSIDWKEVIAESALATGVAHGRLAVATVGAAQPIASGQCRGVEITAFLTNTGVVCYGGSGVVAALASRVGTPLEAGDSRYLPIADLGAVYLDAEVASEGVTYTYLR